MNQQMSCRLTLQNVGKSWLLVILVAWAACDTSEPGLDEELAAASSCTPDWVRDAVFYQIFPERFRNGDPDNDPVRVSIENAEAAPESWHIMHWTADWYERAGWELEMGDDFYDSVFHRRYGGDLQGVLDKLDYLQELGITAIYFNPVFHARSLHKYDGTSFHHIDPYFGPDPAGDLALMAREIADNPQTWIWTAADSLFLALVDQMHMRGMRIIIDGVFNHTGRDFFAFEDLTDKQTDSRFRDWYKVTSWDNPATEASEFDYEGWWGYKPLPEFADSEDQQTLASGPAEYIGAITRRWMDPNGDGDPSDGIDGWRLDVATDVPSGFWRAWHEEVCQINPNAYTVAEIWDDPAELIAEAGFGGAMNYDRFAYPVTGFLIDGWLNPGDLGRRMLVPPAGPAHLNLIDSHDTDRLASMIVNANSGAYEREDRFDYDHASGPRNNAAYSLVKPGERERLIQRMVVLLQATWQGPPMVYYGSASGMWGADDPDDRMPMVWSDLDYAPQTHDPMNRVRPADPVVFDSSLFDYYRQAFNLRHRHEALRRGTVHTIAAIDSAMTWVFSRQDGQEELIVALNRSEADSRILLPESFSPEELDVVFVSQNAEVVFGTGTDGSLTVELPGLTGAVLSASGADS